MKNKINLLEIFTFTLLSLTIFSILLLFKDKIEDWYFGGALFLIIVLVFIYNNYIKRKRNKSSDYINNNLESINKKKRDFTTINKLFNLLNSNQEKNNIIDDQTFNDLDMQKVFSKLDYTLSTPGEQSLYNLLRNPLYDSFKYEQRKTLINLFQKDTTTRNKIQSFLYELGKQYKGDILELIYTTSDVSKHKKFLYNFMFVLSCLSLISIGFLKQYSIIFIMIVFSINMSIHYKANKNILSQVISITYLSKVLSCAKNISNIKNENLAYYNDIINTNIEKCHVILKNSRNISKAEGIDILGDYFNVFFLSQVRSYYNIIGDIEDQREYIKEIYSIIGEIDSIISISIYRNLIKDYVEPKFIDKPCFLEATDLRNPLIENAIPNDFIVNNNGIVITGSNMAGKSTFLKTLGINSLLAHTICTCLAKDYKTSYFNIISSISPSDDITKGKSYYLAEAEAVLRIINSLNDKVSTLCIIDEIFRGTNPLERTSASLEILRYIINKNAIPVVATHDLEIAELVGDQYSCYYFSEDVDEENGLKFDYKMKKGISPTRNAIKLLKYLKYPSIITENADERIRHLLEP
ncbi:MutS-related protein [Clostridium algidicarnis]|uniref:MutS-related protein n=1 Tax=Clostridium algidicarnis TaxID=37659 RepID=UPI001C0B2989|nr:DNA mismatch repair protein MutS [Clostridium algidicarnis]MBU3226586.1 DNA mismatch repair protein MutS [Clostridium algidicarnis]MBU3250503.1 DNA mismatch repair protein MutS [Clostridium algidicarnis]